MQCACTILSSVACPALQYYSILSHKQHDKKKKVTEYIMCALIFSTTFVSSISHSKKKWARYDKKMYISLHVKYPLFLSDFNDAWIFLTDFWKIPKYKISWKSVQWGPSCSMWTDVTKLTVTFCNFANAPKNVMSYNHQTTSDEYVPSTTNNPYINAM